MPTKRCPGCGQVKDLEEFGKNDSTPDKKQSYCLVCMRIAWQKSSKKNIEHRKEYMLAYRRKNKDKIKKRKAEYRKKNSDKTREYDREYRQTHPEQKEKARKRTLRWRQDNPERKKEQDKNWAKHNPEKVRKRSYAFFLKNKGKLYADNQRKRDNLEDIYIKKCIHDRFGLTRSQITPEMIVLKRESILIYRELLTA